uniref:PDZ domain-containing protein n=1 Tax=Onchocerca volvulus TaxID=6282 RepID=A0A8R1Y280_ONCVO
MSTTTNSAAIGPTGVVHCQQNANYVTPAEHYVFVHRVECLRDGGILDPDDQLFDVFDENNDQILAIYDEPSYVIMDSAPTSSSRFANTGIISSSSSPTAKTAASTESTLDGKLNIISSSSDGDIVEITNITVAPTDGLQVIPDNTHILQQKPSSSSVIMVSESVSPSTSPSTHFDQKRTGVSSTRRIYHSALKNVSGSPRSKYRVTISPDVDHLSSQESSTFTKESPMTRSSTRKSRLTDNFFDAKERLEEKLANDIKSCAIKTDMKSSKLIPLMEAANRGQTVITFSDSTINMQLGIEISPVYDPANNMHLQAVEIRQIDDEGRVGSDGRLRVGDRIVEINQRPVYQMSISRARAYLHEIQAVAHPSLTIDRSIETFTSDIISHRSQLSANSLQKRPILSALQQANTTVLGTTFPVEIVKRSGGFGFTITSRETGRGERLFYIGTVKADGAAVNKLRAGDRLLEINGEKTTELTQNDMVERLKKLNVGDSINLLVSRLGNQENENQNSTTAKSNHDDRKCCHQERRANEGTEQYGEEILTLKIALNETGSAGLGISLKARAIMKPDGTRHDCGIFVKKVLHGGAAYKDGRLQLNDQLIGIEDIDLRRMTKNSEASDAITRCLKNLGPNASNVCLKVARKVELRHSNDSPDTRMIPYCKSSKAHDGYRTKSEDNDEAIVKNQRTSNDYNADMSRHRLSSSGEHSLNTNEDLDSISSDRQKCISEDEMNHVDISAFSRKNPARKSISEKRHMGIGNDANNTMLFQKIKHNRQMSAPLLQHFVPFVSPSVQQSAMSSSRSATSLREKCRRQSLALLRSSDEKTDTGRSIGNREKIITMPSATSASNIKNERINVALSSSSPNRRSISLESMEAHRSELTTVSAHPSGPAFRDARGEQTARRGHPNTLKRAQKSRTNGCMKQAISDAEDHNSEVVYFQRLPRDLVVRDRVMHLQKRWYRLALRKILSKMRIDHQEWNKESKSNQSIRRAPPPYKPSSSDILRSTGPDYYVNEMPGTCKTEILCNAEELPASGYIRVANSKFYYNFAERNKEHPEMHCMAGGNNVRQQFATTNVEAEKEETHASVDKQEMDVTMNYTCNLVNSSSNNNFDSIESTHNVVTKSDVNSSNNTWRITRDAIPITTTPSMLGLRTVQLPHTQIYLLLEEEEADIRPNVLTLPQQQQKQCHPTEQRYNKFATKDSSLVQLSLPHQEFERDRISKGLVPITQPAMPHIPVVFPTSRTFFFASSTPMSRHRTNDSRAETRSSLRNRAKSIFTRPFKEQPKSSLKPQTSISIHEHFYRNQQPQSSRNSIPRQPLLLDSHQSQQKECPSFFDNFTSSSPPSKASVPSAPYLSYDFDRTTLSSPTYLQALLKSPAKDCKHANVINVPKPIKYIKIHYGPSNPSFPKQQPLRSRTLDIRSPNNDSFQQGLQQQTRDDFDYRKYLRATRRNRTNDQEQRVTLIDETMFMRGTATCRAPRPNTVYNVTTNN